MEEQYCEEYAYPGITAQINAHKQYQSDIMQIMHKMTNPRIDIDMLSEEVANFSMNWLTRHILSEDKKIGEWYKKTRHEKQWSPTAWRPWFLPQQGAPPQVGQQNPT